MNPLAALASERNGDLPQDIGVADESPHPEVPPVIGDGFQCCDGRPFHDDDLEDEGDFELATGRRSLERQSLVERDFEASERDEEIEERRQRAREDRSRRQERRNGKRSGW